MVRNPGATGDDDRPTPPGGDAARRLREHLDARYGEDDRPETALDDGQGETGENEPQRQDEADDADKTTD
jgi:hypothetical protein